MAQVWDVQKERRAKNCFEDLTTQLQEEVKLAFWRQWLVSAAVAVGHKRISAPVATLHLLLRFFIPVPEQHHLFVPACRAGSCRTLGDVLLRPCHPSALPADGGCQSAEIPYQPPFRPWVAHFAISCAKVVMSDDTEYKGSSILAG